VGLAVVRSIRSPRQLGSQQEIEDFEQELVDQYALAMAATGSPTTTSPISEARCSTSSGTSVVRCGRRSRAAARLPRHTATPLARNRQPAPVPHQHTGRRTEECSKRWIWLTIGPDLSIAAIREDRILDEAHATGGDVRRLAHLFGPSIQAGSRYTNVLSHPDLDGNDQS
jgi:hypothetical protein